MIKQIKLIEVTRRKHKYDAHHYQSTPSQSRPLFTDKNGREGEQLPWQSYFPADVTDKLVELVPVSDSPQKGVLDTSASTQCTAQRLQQVPDTIAQTKRSKPKSQGKKSSEKKKTEGEEQQQSTKVFIDDKKHEQTVSSCWGCCAQSSDQYTKMTHEETPQYTKNNPEENNHHQNEHPAPPPPPSAKRSEAAARKLEYMPVSPQLPDFRAYRHGHNGPVHNPYIPPDVVFKIYEHPMKYNHPTRQNHKQVRAPLLKHTRKEARTQRSSGEESSYFSSTEWEEEAAEELKEQDDKEEEEESSDPWSNNTQVTARKLMSSFKPELTQKDIAKKKQEESDESGKGPSDLSNEEKTPSKEDEKDQPVVLQASEASKQNIIVKPLTQENVQYMDKQVDEKHYGEVVEKTDVLSNPEQELSYKIYRHYGSSQHDDTDTTSGIANTFQSSHNPSELTPDSIPLPTQSLIKTEQPESETSFHFATDITNDQESTQITKIPSVQSMSTESNLDQSSEFGVLTESEFYFTGQESDATFGTLSSYGSHKKNIWLSDERLLEMHPVLKLCQEDGVTETDNSETKSLDFDYKSLDYHNQNTVQKLDNQIDIGNLNSSQAHTRSNEDMFQPLNSNLANAGGVMHQPPECLPQPPEFPGPPDSSVIEGDGDTTDSDGSLPPPPPPLTGSEEEGMVSEYSTLEMPIPMPLLHYSHLELTSSALETLPDSTQTPGLYSHLKRSFSNLSSPDSISKDSTVTMLSESMLPPEPALQSQPYYSSSIDSSSNISDASEGPQTVVCAMVHSPGQPDDKQADFDSNSLVKQLPSKSTVNSGDPQAATGQTNDIHNDQVKTYNSVSNTPEQISSPSHDVKHSHSRNIRDKNCVLFNFDDKIVEEQASPKASSKSTTRNYNGNNAPASPTKPSPSSKQHEEQASRKASAKSARKKRDGTASPAKTSPFTKLHKEKPTPTSNPQPPLNRLLLELPPSASLHSPKKDSDTTHSGSYGAGSYGYTDFSSGSTGNQPIQYAALPPMNIGKCIVKFGEKSVHSVQQPGHFSHPKAIDVFPNRDIAILDSENCTLQIFSEKGMCKKVYQFRSGIIDMIVWDKHTLALLKPGEISMFSLPRYEMDSLRLKDIQFPIALRKMTLPKQESVFVVAMVTHVAVYTQQGDFLHTIPSHVDKRYGNLYIKRIGRITVNPKNCDVIIVDIDLRTIYIFGWEGDHKYTIDTKYFPIGPVANPQGIGLDNLGNILIADSFNHRVVQIFQGGVRVLLQYQIEFFPCAVVVTRDNRLVVAMDCEGRSFAGVRVYNYRHAIR